MSWIKKTELELENEKKEKLAYLAEQKKKEKEEYVPIHPYNILHSNIGRQPSWLNKDTKDDIKKPDDVKTGWKEISYDESLHTIANMIKSSNTNNSLDKILLADMMKK